MSPALLIIDMQQGIQRLDRPRNNPEAEQRIADLLERWRQARWPLAHIRHISREPGSVFAPGQDGALFQAELAPLPTEQVFEKNVTDAFTHSNLGFATRVVADACYTFDKTDYAGRPRSAEDVHDMAMANLRDEYAEVVRSADLIAALFGAPERIG